MNTDSDNDQISGWGRQFVPGIEILSDNLESLDKQIICRGLGRSYGDASLPAPGNLEVVGSKLYNKILSFDEKTGLIKAQCGLSQFDLNKHTLPKGWFISTSPGTQYVTVGGMVASDVHGKNHHVSGSFGNHIKNLTIKVADGSIINCSRENEKELFLATIGGMGLTGIILDVEFKLGKVSSPWIYCNTKVVSTVQSLISELTATAEKWPFAVGWIDSLTTSQGFGRGILSYGRWAESDEAPENFPELKTAPSLSFVPPDWLLNKYSVELFNLLYYWMNSRNNNPKIANPQSFFYNLDALQNWNRLYGPNGFVQYQCVLPDMSPNGSVRQFFKLLQKYNIPSYLGVIKICGDESDGILSFPKKGFSIAIDIPMVSNVQDIVDKLNEFVIENQGRVYLTKDALSKAEHFKRMEPRLEKWLAVRKKWDPELKFKSAQSVRLFGK